MIETATDPAILLFSVHELVARVSPTVLPLAIADLDPDRIAEVYRLRWGEDALGAPCTPERLAALLVSIGWDSTILPTLARVLREELFGGEREASATVQAERSRVYQGILVALHLVRLPR